MVIVLTVVLLLLSLVCEAQHSPYSLKFTVSPKEFVDTIPLDYVRGQVLLPVRFGNKSYRFLFDTGASQTTLFADAIPEGATPAGFTVSHDAIASRDTVSKFYLPPMTIGSTTFTGCQATVHQRIGRNPKSIDGIIGFDIICRGLSAKIDVRNGLLILTDRPDFFQDETGICLKYKLNLHVPYVEVCPFGNYREQALFDTGSRQLYMMHKRSFDKGVRQTKTNLGSQMEGRCMGRHAIGHGGVEPRGEVVFLALDRLLLGQFAFCDVHTLTTTGDSHIGSKLLEYGAVVFNPKRRSLCFQPYGNARSAVVANQPLDKVVVPVSNRPVVGLVRVGSEPYHLGFREGDIILMIDQRPVNTFADYLRFQPVLGCTYTFILCDSNGNLKQVDCIW